MQARNLENVLRQQETNWYEAQRALKLLTLIMEEIEQGSPNLLNRGGQSRGWKIFHWISRRYSVPACVEKQILNGYVRWMT